MGDPTRPPPSTLAIALAAALILGIFTLALPAVVSIVHPPVAPIATEIAPAVPTAPVITATAEPALAPSATQPAAGPPAGAPLLPAAVPAGATPNDRMFTVYAGWPYQVTGDRQVDSCELEIWPDGNPPSDRLWIDCSLVGL